MKSEDQVCATEQAKKLKELGVMIETQFVWTRSKELLVYDEFYSAIKDYPEEFDSAPNVAELGVLLPANIDTEYYSYHLFSGRSVSGNYFVGYETEPLKDDFAQFTNSNEAQARAEALIWLLENKYIKPEDLKL